MIDFQQFNEDIVGAPASAIGQEFTRVTANSQAVRASAQALVQNYVSAYKDISMLRQDSDTGEILDETDQYPERVSTAINSLVRTWMAMLPTVATLLEARRAGRSTPQAYPCDKHWCPADKPDAYSWYGNGRTWSEGGQITLVSSDSSNKIFLNHTGQANQAGWKAYWTGPSGDASFHQWKEDTMAKSVTQYLMRNIKIGRETTPMRYNAYPESLFRGRPWYMVPSNASGQWHGLQQAVPSTPWLQYSAQSAFINDNAAGDTPQFKLPVGDYEWETVNNMQSTGSGMRLQVKRVDIYNMTTGSVHAPGDAYITEVGLIGDKVTPRGLLDPTGNVYVYVRIDAFSDSYTQNQQTGIMAGEQLLLFNLPDIDESYEPVNPTYALALSMGATGVQRTVDNALNTARIFSVPAWDTTQKYIDQNILSVPVAQGSSVDPAIAAPDVYYVMKVICDFIESQHLTTGLTQEQREVLNIPIPQ